MKPIVLVAVALPLACGSAAPSGPTEVRVIVESDLAAPDPVAFLVAGTADGLSDTTFESPPLPFIIVVEHGSTLEPFSIHVELLRDLVSGNVLVLRNLVDVQFVSGQELMVALPMLAKCACQGTACPQPGDPDCADLTAPALSPVDPAFAGTADLFIDLAAHQAVP